MSSSNLPRLWGLVTAACTYEGENTVLQLQVYFQAMSTFTAPQINSYLVTCKTY